MLKLVYACLAFSLVACVILFVSAARKTDGFHGMTKSMGDAIANGATVLDADRDGAITQTGNGHVTGFKRGGGSAWSTRFDRFAEGPTNPYGAGANDASAWCTTACPGAIVEFVGAYSSFGDAKPALAESLQALEALPEDVLAVVGEDSAFVRKNELTTTRPRLFVVVPGHKAKALEVINPSEVQPSRPDDRAIVGTARGRVGGLVQLQRSGGAWQLVGKSIREEDLKNVCVSADNAWVGSVSSRIRRFAFGDSQGGAIGPAVSGGTCTVDKNGITAVFTQESRPGEITAARFGPEGRTLWIHEFGAQRLLSSAGSPYVVAQGSDGAVTAIDAVTGQDAYRGKITSAPFVGRDGSIVTADRKGNPHWVLVGKQPDSQ